MPDPDPDPEKPVTSQFYMDPKSIFRAEILRFGLGFGHFLNSTKEFILIKEDSFVSIFYDLLMF